MFQVIHKVQGSFQRYSVLVVVQSAQYQKGVIILTIDQQGVRLVSQNLLCLCETKGQFDSVQVNYGLYNYSVLFLYRFGEELKTLGVLDQIRRHPESFPPLFCYEWNTLTADQVDDLFSIRLSPEGSNKWAAEEMVVTFWRGYLQDAEGN